MSKDLMFKMRLDEEDRKRLDEIAVHYSAPAATALRILIKTEHDRIQKEKARSVRWVESNELYQRAVRMYFAKLGDDASQPNRSRTGFNDPEQTDVLVLENANGPLARIRYDAAGDRLIWLKKSEKH